MHVKVVLAVTAGHVAVPPEFKASEDVPVEVTASEKVTVMDTVSLAFLEPLDVVVTEDTVGAVVSAIDTDVPASEYVTVSASLFLKSELISVVGVNAPLAPPVPVARKARVTKVIVPVAPLVFEYPIGSNPVAPVASSGTKTPSEELDEEEIYVNFDVSKEILNVAAPRFDVIICAFTATVNVAPALTVAALRSTVRRMASPDACVEAAPRGDNTKHKAANRLLAIAKSPGVRNRFGMINSSVVLAVNGPGSSVSVR